MRGQAAQAPTEFVCCSLKDVSLIFLSYFLALLFKDVMLLVMSFGGLCAIRRLCSLVEASVLPGGGWDYGSMHARVLLLGPATAAPAILWLQSNLQVLRLACFPFPSAVTAKL